MHHFKVTLKSLRYVQRYLINQTKCTHYTLTVLTYIKTNSYDINQGCDI